jgi:hypothetical protein
MAPFALRDRRADPFGGQMSWREALRRAALDGHRPRLDDGRHAPAGNRTGRFGVWRT